MVTRGGQRQGGDGFRMDSGVKATGRVVRLPQNNSVD